VPGINFGVRTAQRARPPALLQEFAGEILGAWKEWLTGSLPMVALSLASLVKPDWTRFPPWVWVLLIFMAGLFFATFRVYRELRRQRDVLHRRLARISIAGPYLLVPWTGDLNERIENDL
jgi:hypothetical protein